MKSPLLTIHLILVVIFLSTVQCYDWTAVDQLLDDSINKHAFPGCVALVADKTGILYLKAKGNNIYPGSSDTPLRPMTIGTRFDMASVTKVLTTTTATALLYQNGNLPNINNIKVSELFPEFALNGKESITVANLMLHNSGLRPDPVPSFPSKTFGCPETSKFHPELSFSCLDKIYDGVMSQPLVNPVGSKFVYSDLSMITMMYVVGYYVRKHNLVADKDLLPLCANSGASDNGKLVCYYEAYARKNIYEYLGMKNTTFITAQNVHDIDVNNIPPAWNDTGYRHELIHGYVSDSNAYALGGISGK
jgi:CubicO group peptidase (beta-lactamase class C family)